MPQDMKRIVEVGCSSGALARAYTAMNPGTVYTGVEIDPDYAEISREHCDEVICGNIESLDEKAFLGLFPSDCWVFGDVLEHLYDPWALLKRIRPHLPGNAQLVACIPNAQHWSIQARLNAGLFRYEDKGLLDRTHIRWFTRITSAELFESTGYKIIEMLGRVLEEPDRERFFPAIKMMAEIAGTNPERAVRDSIPYQWIIKAVPA